MIGNLISGYIEGANYRRLKQSLRSQRATEQRMDDMLRLAVARTEGERQAIAGEIIGERNGRERHRSHVRQTTAGLVVGLIVAAFVGASYLPELPAAPEAPAIVAQALPSPAGAYDGCAVNYDPYDVSAQVFHYGCAGDGESDMRAGMGKRALDSFIAECRDAKAQGITTSPVSYSMTESRIVQDDLVQEVQNAAYQRGQSLSYADAATVQRNAHMSMSSVKPLYNDAKAEVRDAVNAAGLSDACPAQ